MATAAFSSDGAAVIERKTTSEKKTLYNGDMDIQDFYELDRCKLWIQSRNLKQVALQFPDELLCDSVKVYENLREATTANVFILGDTSYGSCCVDEVAAQHYNADSIIHFGRSCLSPSNRLPVLFVFGKSSVDVEDCVEKFKEVVKDTDCKLILMYDVIYHHIAGNLSEQLCENFPNLVCADLQVLRDTDVKSGVMNCVEDSNMEVHTTTTVCRCGRVVKIPKDSTLEEYSVLYIGKESLTLTNLMMNFNKCEFFTYDGNAKSVRKETLNVSKALMKRYYMIERAKDAGIVGIVVGTLGVSDYLQIINRLKEVIKKAGKKSYTFVVGKLNVAKLANFMEVDVFVLVSCNENTLIDSSEFYKPVVTPLEMEMACNKARQWTGDYFTDFRELLPGAAGHVEIPLTVAEEDQFDVSLVTGKLRRHGVEDEQDDKNSTALLSRDSTLTVASTGDAAANFLSERHWKGLERNLGETPVTVAVQGQRGIAASYNNETSQDAS